MARFKSIEAYNDIRKPYPITEEELYDHVRWLMEVDIKDAEVAVNLGSSPDSADYLSWYGGTFIDGYWETGTWWGGTWQDGVWMDGVWHDGTWMDGIWEYGDWNDGTWMDGVWKDGSWLDGYWEGGTWEDGIWNPPGSPPGREDSRRTYQSRRSRDFGFGGMM